MAKNPLITDERQVWKHTGRPIEFEYRTDNDLFYNPPASDRRVNPDYYRASNTVGDSEDFSGVCILEANRIPVEVIGVKRLSRQLLSFPRHWITVRSSTKGE